MDEGAEHITNSNAMRIQCTALIFQCDHDAVAQATSNLMW